MNETHSMGLFVPVAPRILRGKINVDRRASTRYTLHK